VSSAAFSSDGSRVVTASWDNTARLWDGKTGALLATLAGHEDWVWNAAFSPDGSHVVTASWDKTARLWDGKTGALLATLAGHGARALNAAFSPDGSRVVTTSRDKTARLWDGKTGAPLATLAGHEGPVSSAAFSPDGSRVVTASWDKAARIWQIDPIILMEASERRDFVCRERLIGAQSFTDLEMRDPILLGREDLRNPCDRVGPLSFEYYLRAVKTLWNNVRGAVGARGTAQEPDDR
jgi:predicted NACHT family NTPase